MKARVESDVNDANSRSAVLLKLKQLWQDDVDVT